MENRPHSLVDHAADGLRTHQKTIVIVMKTGVIFIERTDKFGRIPWKKEILQINIAEHHLLVPPVENSIQSAIGIFFQQIEIRRVVLNTVAMQISKNPQPRLLVNKKKPAEVRVEL